jgi:hypothetical protein
MVKRAVITPPNHFAAQMAVERLAGTMKKLRLSLQ